MSQWDRSIAEWFATPTHTETDVLRLKEDSYPSPARKAEDKVTELPGPAATHPPLLPRFLELDKQSFEAADERRDDPSMVGGWSDYPGQSRDVVLPKVA